jgi:hypothetical protein
VREAQAAQIRIAANLSTLENECAEQGGDWRENLEQLAVERAERARLKVPEAPLPGSQQTSAPDPNQQADNATNPDDETSPNGAPPKSPGTPGGARYGTHIHAANFAAIVAAAVDPLAEQLAALTAGMLANAARPMPASENHFHEGAFKIEPARVEIAEGAVRVEPAITHVDVHLPARGIVEKEVLERDAEGRIARTRETEIPPAAA